MRKTLKLRLITAAQCEQFFLLDSPGYFIARDAMNAGETATATDALEVLCLANELYESELLNRLIVELAPYGKLEEYAEGPTKARISSSKCWGRTGRCVSFRTLQTR
jgi:hypothetical protein